MRVTLTERLYPKNMKDQEEQLEKMITKQIQKQFGDLILKIIEHRVFPIGLGIYARANEYKRYKSVEEQWGETVAGN